MMHLPYNVWRSRPTWRRLTWGDRTRAAPSLLLRRPFSTLRFKNFCVTAKKSDHESQPLETHCSSFILALLHTFSLDSTNYGTLSARLSYQTPQFIDYCSLQSHDLCKKARFRLLSSNRSHGCEGLYVHKLRDVIGANCLDNPFARREEFSRSNLLAYKVLTIITWLLLIISGAYYTFNKPADCRHHHCHTIWGQNSHRPTPFGLNSVVTSTYWVLILILQANYIRYLWSADTAYLNSSANVGSHFILVSLPWSVALHII